MAHHPKEKEREKDKEAHGHGAKDAHAHPHGNAHPEESVKELKKALLEKRNQIRGNINLELNDVKESEGHHLADMEDLASDSLDESTAFHIIELEQGELAQIEHALQLIEEGNYGRCEECQAQITLERLRALPFAILCIECKKDQERRGG